MTAECLPATRDCPCHLPLGTPQKWQVFYQQRPLPPAATCWPCYVRRENAALQIQWPVRGRACNPSRTLRVILWRQMWLRFWTPGTVWTIEDGSHLSYCQGLAWELNQARGKQRPAMAAESNSAPATFLENSWVSHGWGSYNLIDSSQDTKFFYWLNLAPSRAHLGNGLDHIQECPAKRAWQPQIWPRQAVRHFHNKYREAWHAVGVAKSWTQLRRNWTDNKYRSNQEVHSEKLVCILPKTSLLYRIHSRFP